MITFKKIVLTGADSGIGLETLKLLAKDGTNKILAVDINCENMDKIGSNVIPMKIDVSSQQAVDEIFEKAEAEFGKIDIFYANAGYPYYELMDYVDWDRTARMFETNVYSPIYSYQKYHNRNKNQVFHRIVGKFWDAFLGAVLARFAAP